ncbi:hypothetical protein HDU67_000325, partial [Dinochytrium kinnereticum]
MTARILPPTSFGLASLGSLDSLQDLSETRIAKPSAFAGTSSYLGLRPSSSIPLHIAIRFNKPTLYVIYQEKRTGKKKKRRIPLRHFVNDDLTIRASVTLTTRQIVAELTEQNEILRGIKAEQVRLLSKSTLQLITNAATEVCPNAFVTIGEFDEFVRKPDEHCRKVDRDGEVKHTSACGVVVLGRKSEGESCWSGREENCKRGGWDEGSEQAGVRGVYFTSASDAELNDIKKQMEKEFEKTLLKPGDPGFQYEVTKTFDGPKESNDWDEDSSSSIPTSRSRAIGLVVPPSATPPAMSKDAFGEMETEDDIDEEIEEDEFEYDDEEEEHDIGASTEKRMDASTRHLLIDKDGADKGVRDHRFSAISRENQEEEEEDWWLKRSDSKVEKSKEDKTPKALPTADVNSSSKTQPPLLATTILQTHDDDDAKYAYPEDEEDEGTNRI